MNSKPPRAAAVSPSRRTFVQGLFLGGVAASTGLLRIPDARARDAAYASPGAPLAGRDLQLDIGASTVNFTGRARPAITVNNSLPAPLLRWREGDTVTIRVANRLPGDTQTSIHWHGILLPSNMDGVPGMSFDGIYPGESYLYRFQ
ncbi:MAG: multicopper oxidase domain-containing protein, partial [Luteimonas sp.]|nr:multicopper oxidase domain-containing protein [Luteimonas sp.]